MAIKLIQHAAAKGSKIMAIADGGGDPVAIGVTSALPNGSTLVASTLDRHHIGPLPQHMIGERTYSELYPGKSEDEAGLREFFRQIFAACTSDMKRVSDRDKWSSWP